MLDNLKIIGFMIIAFVLYVLAFGQKSPPPKPPDPPPKEEKKQTKPRFCPHCGKKTD